MNPLDFSVEELDTLFDLANKIEKNPKDKRAHNDTGNDITSDIWKMKNLHQSSG